MTTLVRTLENTVTRVAPDWLVSLALRFGVAIPFWKSGLTKWDGFGVLSETPIVLFENEFLLHVLGQEYNFPFPTFMAYASSIGEIVLPILVVFGLFTRFAALGLLFMTLIIQLTFPDAWPLHLTWAAMAVGVMYLGGSRVSVDRLLFGR
jgi:putative oxidoreductase